MNKQATRAAIIAATVDLLRTAGREATTAAAIAEAAGISRRTLFNYFPSVDAIVADPLRRLLDRVVELLGESDARVPLLTAAVQALHGAGVPELLAPVAELSLGARADGVQSAEGYSNQWQDASTDVVQAIERHSPHADPFEVRIFAHAVLGAGQAAFEEWTRRLSAPPGKGGATGPKLTTEQIQLLHSLLTHALEQLSEGFPALHSTADSTDKDL